jgi:hypothetical protein
MKNSYIIGFVKRAAEYGFDKAEALHILKRANEGVRSNPQISSEINSINANPLKPQGSAAVMDFPQKGVVPPKLPAYTPNNESPHQGPATYLESIPVLGHFIGPPARLMEGDPVGAGLGLATDALALAPGGLAAAGGLSIASKFRDMHNYLGRKADIAKKMENTNRPVQG